MSKAFAASRIPRAKPSWMRAVFSTSCREVLTPITRPAAMPSSAVAVGYGWSRILNAPEPPPPRGSAAAGKEPKLGFQLRQSDFWSCTVNYKCRKSNSERTMTQVLSCVVENQKGVMEMLAIGEETICESNSILGSLVWSPRP